MKPLHRPKINAFILDCETPFFGLAGTAVDDGTEGHSAHTPGWVARGLGDRLGTASPTPWYSDLRQERHASL